MICLRTLGTIELVGDDGREVGPIAVQPKRLALLVYLAAARPRGFHRRDTLVGLFWPESPESRARGALGQALYFLRRSLGRDVVIGRGHEDIAIAAERLWCDAAAAHDALESDEVESAIDLYRGDFLPGFFVTDAPAFEDWLDRERSHLRRAVLEAASVRADDLASRDPNAAAALLRRALEIAPEDEGALRRLLRLLDSGGDRAAALATYDAFSRRLAADLGSEPSPETRALRDAIIARVEPRAGTEPSGTAPIPLPAVPPEPVRATPGAPPGSVPASGRSSEFGPSDRHVTTAKRAAVIGLTLLTTTLLARSLRGPVDGGAPPGNNAGFTLAVAPFTTAAADSGLERIAREVVVPLSANLDGLGDVRAVEGVEVLANAGPAEAADAAVALAGRLGASRVLYGAIVAAGSTIRAEATLRRVADGGPVLRVSVHAERNVSALADSLTWAVLAELWKDPLPVTDSATVSPPEPGPAALGTRSLPALRAFWEGERAAAQGRWNDGAEHFARAIALDSTYWFAYWRHAYARFTMDAPVDPAIRGAYESRRAGFPERDRLLIESRMADSLSGVIERLIAINRRFPDYWLGWWDYANRLVHDGPLIGRSRDETRAALERALALRPADVIVLQHLFWLAAQEADVRTMADIVRHTQELRAASPDFVPARPDYLLLFQMVLAAARADPELLAASIDDNIADLIDNVPGAAGDQFSMGLATWGFHDAQIELSRRMIESNVTPQLEGAQRRSLMLTWAARGAWDGAVEAAHTYVNAVDGPVSLQHAFRMAVAGEWLGALPRGVADGWRERLATYEDQLQPVHVAELAWLDGVLASARGQADALAAARRRLRTMSGDRPESDVPPVLKTYTPASFTVDALARMLDGSLLAFELALNGRELHAAEHLSELERQRVERGWTRALGRWHPYVTGLDRLAAARWLRANGRPADAERLLRWIEAVEFPGYLVSEATALLSSAAYHERALCAEALSHTDEARRHYAQFLRRFDSPVPALRHLREQARMALPGR